MATKIETRKLEITIKNPKDGREIAIAAIKNEGELTIKFLEDVKDYVKYAPHIMVIKDGINAITVTYSKEVEVTI